MESLEIEEISEDCLATEVQNKHNLDQNLLCCQTEQKTLDVFFAPASELEINVDKLLKWAMNNPLRVKNKRETPTNLLYVEQPAKALHAGGIGQPGGPEEEVFIQY